ncbi:MAG: glycosyltransferase [Thermomicrobiales bacterium]
MAALNEVSISPASLDRFAAVIGGDALREAKARAASTRERMEGRTWWNVNSTSQGGGVAEMLHVLLPYVLDAGIQTRWSVLDGNQDFFRITKRLHHALHGSAGDGSPLDEDVRDRYETVLRQNQEPLIAAVKADDVVLLHDPQTAGMVQPLVEAGALVIWRCHIGSDARNEETERGWRFLESYLTAAAATVWSREAYIPGSIAKARAVVIVPSIDAFSPKNQELGREQTLAILARTGLIAGPDSGKTVSYSRQDGSTGTIERQAAVVRGGNAPHPGAPVVCQISRWDPLKDHAGVMRAFAKLVENGTVGDAHLVLAGPDVTAVTDDPEGAETYAELLAAWEELSRDCQSRVHLANLPMADADENAVIVNALQRHSAVIVQKSLQEGFGLTVTEAMWKARPVLASAVGGILDQITDGEQGLLLSDPYDLDAAADGIYGLLHDGELAGRLGTAAKERVREQFLGIRHLSDYADLLAMVETG